MTDRFSGVIPLRDLQCKDVYQRILDDKLHILVVIPGINRDTLHVRTRPDMIVISADYGDELNEITGNKLPIDIRIQTIKRIDVGKHRAKYVDGILRLTFDLDRDE